MCWVCEDWKEASPKTFKRWVACAQGRGNKRDAAIISSGFQIAKEQFDKVGAENILRELDKDTTAEIVFEGDLMCRNKISRSDLELLDWAFQHEFQSLLEVHRKLRHPQGAA